MESKTVPGGKMDRLAKRFAEKFTPKRSPHDSRATLLSLPHSFALLSASPISRGCIIHIPLPYVHLLLLIHYTKSIPSRFSASTLKIHVYDTKSLPISASFPTLALSNLRRVAYGRSSPMSIGCIALPLPLKLILPPNMLPQLPLPYPLPHPLPYPHPASSRTLTIIPSNSSTSSSRNLLHNKTTTTSTSPTNALSYFSAPHPALCRLPTETIIRRKDRQAVVSHFNSFLKYVERNESDAYIMRSQRRTGLETIGMDCRNIDEDEDEGEGEGEGMAEGDEEEWNGSIQGEMSEEEEGMSQDEMIEEEEGLGQEAHKEWSSPFLRPPPSYPPPAIPISMQPPTPSPRPAKTRNQLHLTRGEYDLHDHDDLEDETTLVLSSEADDDMDGMLAAFPYPSSSQPGQQQQQEHFFNIDHDDDLLGTEEEGEALIMSLGEPLFEEGYGGYGVYYNSNDEANFHNNYVNNLHKAEHLRHDYQESEEAEPSVSNEAGAVQGQTSPGKSIETDNMEEEEEEEADTNDEIDTDANTLDVDDDDDDNLEGESGSDYSQDDENDQDENDDGEENDDDDDDEFKSDEDDEVYGYEEGEEGINGDDVDIDNILPVDRTIFFFNPDDRRRWLRRQRLLNNLLV